MPSSALALLSADERRFIDEPGRYATIATINPDGTPLQAHIWYLAIEEGILINSRVGRRWPTNLLRDPRVSIVVSYGYPYVRLSGRVTPIHDQQRAQADIATLARRYNSPEAAEERIERQFRREQRISFLLAPSAAHSDLSHYVRE